VSTKHFTIAEFNQVVDMINNSQVHESLHVE
jgi:hypothetical protein